MEYTSDCITHVCIIYSEKGGNWDNLSHILPYTMRYAMASISPDELFDIIVGGKKDYKTYSNAIITFAEKEGNQRIFYMSCLVLCDMLWLR